MFTCAVQSHEQQQRHVREIGDAKIMKYVTSCCMHLLVSRPHENNISIFKEDKNVDIIELKFNLHKLHK